MEKLIEKVILVGVSETSGADAEESLHELYELAKTAGAETVGRVIQTREYEHPTTYVGSGKLEEIKNLIEATGATGIICDDELTPSQMNNMSKILDTKVMDRTVLILDIFAGRAKTQEGKIQVELAQLRYSLTRLAGYGKSMSRLGGGIGTRGPGETKLESDRRVVKNRISKLKAELKEIVKHRTVTRARRERSNIPVLAIVGYTNAGKSTLLNSLTDSEVLSEDKLFATLDPTTRKYEINSGEEVLLTDTVGFIDKLPHHLIEAFKSTLEEAKYSDIIVHVVDAYDPEAYAKMDVVYDTLHSLDVEGRPVITLFNKCDVAGLNHGYKDIRAYKSINISARTGLGIDEFNKAIEDILAERKVEIKRTFPFTEAGKIQLIRKTGKLLIEDYREDGIYVEAYVPRETAGRL